MPVKQMDIGELIARFGNDDKCRAYLEMVRWPNGVRCPRCQSDKISKIVKRHQYDCDSCGYQFSVRVGTIFHDSHLPLWKWFLAVFLMTQSKKGVSSKQLQRMLGCAYKTAWYLTHRIRAAMKDTTGAQLSGIVEVDETWIGGKTRGFGRGYTGNKALVMGALQRGGKVRIVVITDRTRESLHQFIEQHVDAATEAIFTDDFEAYKGIADSDTIHKTVNHSAREWVVGDVHTNGIEGVWSLLKRSVVGTYHRLSVKHLPAYLEERAFVFNNRENAHIFRDTIRALIAAETVPYETLVA